MEGLSEEAKAKEEFFHRLYALDDEDEPGQPKNQHSKHGRPPPTKRRRANLVPSKSDASSTKVDTPATLIRSQSAPSADTSSSSDGNPPDPVGQSVRSTTSLRKVSAAKATENIKSIDSKSSTRKDKAKMPPKKSRKSNEGPPVPDRFKIFRNLVFYWIPKGDTAPDRVYRIGRCHSYGASSAAELDATVTHIIAKPSMNYEQVLEHLDGRDPPVNAILVTDNYPVECMQFRQLVVSTGQRFQVDGRPSKAPEIVSSLVQPDAEPTSSSPYQRTMSPSQRHDLASDREFDELTSEVPDSQVNMLEPTIDGEPEIGNVALYKDELHDIFVDMKQTKDMPLDPEDGATSFSSALSVDSASDSKKESPREAPKKRKAEPYNFQAFSCMQKSEGNRDQANPNARTMEILQQMVTYYDRMGDQWRTRAYRKAIAELRRQSIKIMTRDQAIRLPGVGDRLADKIEEIVWTNRLRRLEATEMEPKDKILQLFIGIYQVGFPLASKWVAQGYRTFEDLKANVALTTNQRIGIDHYDDFQQRIPRSEVAAHGEIVRKEAMKEDPEMQVIIGGSYRRGNLTSGDVDLIITRAGATSSDIKRVMTKVIRRLEDKKFLVAGLATGRDKNTGSKWHGASCLPSSKVWRRIDLLFVPWDEMGAAMIYFTGNDIFNRSIRLLASKKNMRLNQHGLYKDFMRGLRRFRVIEGQLIEGKDEKRIFEILGVPYRPPEHRIC